MGGWRSGRPRAPHLQPAEGDCPDRGFGHAGTASSPLRGTGCLPRFI